jgi:hypothetical protein
MSKKRIKNNNVVLEIPDRRELLRKYINIFQALYVPEDKWLTSRVKDFLVECLILFYDGIPIHSKEMIDSLNAHFAFNSKNKNSYIYRGDLVKLNWLTWEKDGIYPDPTFLKEFDELKLQVLITNHAN